MNMEKGTSAVCWGFSRLVLASWGLAYRSLFPSWLDILDTSALQPLPQVICLLHLKAQQRINSGAHHCRWLKENTECIWPERPRCCPLDQGPDPLWAVLQPVPIVQLGSSTLSSGDSDQLWFKDNSQQHQQEDNRMWWRESCCGLRFPLRRR